MPNAMPPLIIVKQVALYYRTVRSIKLRVAVAGDARAVAVGKHAKINQKIVAAVPVVVADARFVALEL